MKTIYAFYSRKMDEHLQRFTIDGKVTNGDKYTPIYLRTTDGNTKITAISDSINSGLQWDDTQYLGKFTVSQTSCENGCLFYHATPTT